MHIDDPLMTPSIKREEHSPTTYIPLYTLDKDPSADQVSTSSSSGKNSEGVRQKIAAQSSNMKKQLAEHVTGLSISSASYFVTYRMSRLRKKAGNVAHRIREHVRLGPKITETLKGKLSLGARILQRGGVEKVFKQSFSCREGEKLLNASQCYLSTTAGPIAGLLFISTNKVAFCSERSIKIASPNGDFSRVYYKAMIPLSKLKRTCESENFKKPSEKYIQIVTVDNFDFWFMGFLNYQKALRYLQQALSES